MNVSESVEMYLVTIALLGEAGVEMPIPLSKLAEELAVQPVSVNQMVRKLDEEGLVEYLPYKGVSLTQEGTSQAVHILRHRRLWEVFFVRHLGLSPVEAENLACRMEHVTSGDVAERLADFLEQPETSPSGKQIPTETQHAIKTKGRSLAELDFGRSAKVLAIQMDEVTQDFLKSQGLIPGAEIKVLAGNPRALLLQIKQGRLSLAVEIAEKIFVKEQEKIKTDAA